MAETSAPASVPALDAAFEELNVSVARLIVTMAVLRAERDRLRAALYDHERYMLDSGYAGPNDPALHPNAAENWRRIRAALALAARPD